MTLTYDQRLTRRKELKSERLSQGLCVECGHIPHRPGKKTCVHCATRARTLSDPMSCQRRRRESGLCIKCGKMPRAEGVLLCQGCREKFREKSREYHQKKTKPLREQVLAHYGGVCACCGETEPLFLTIDHVNNDGAKHRKEVASNHLAKWLVDNDFPEDFQILCFNCNCGRQRNGGVCPHHNKNEEPT